MNVTILSRHECHLCEVVERLARTVQAEVPFTLSRVDVDAHADLAARYGDRVPVVLIDQVEVLAGAITERDFRRAVLDRARGRGPVSRILSHLRRGLRWR